MGRIKNSIIDKVDVIFKDFKLYRDVTLYRDSATNNRANSLGKPMFMSNVLKIASKANWFVIIHVC